MHVYFTSPLFHVKLGYLGDRKYKTIMLYETISKIALDKTHRQSKIVNIFLFLHKHIYCGYLSEVSQEGISDEYPQHMFSWRNKKKIYLMPSSYLEL